MSRQTRTDALTQLAEQYGTPCFVYFVDDVRARVEALRGAFRGLLSISYAMKCNPNQALLAHMAGLVDTLDVSSRGELARAIAAGWEGRRISFTGPAKQRVCLERALQHGIGEVVVESLREARELSALAEARGVTQSVLLRIAPKQVPKGFGVNMAGRPCQFGVDEEDADAALRELLRLPHLRLDGFHIYSGTQCLKAEAVAENYAIFIELFRRLSSAHQLSPQKLIFGSGLGIRYHEDDTELDLARVAELTVPRLRALKAEPRFANAALLLETGRYLVGEAGYYLTRVVSRKHSRGAEIATCDGGMHHHLGACGHLGMVLHRPYRMFKLGHASTDAQPRSYDLYGPLCTTIDVLGRGVKLPQLEVGDVIAVASSGAYGASASPSGFISHGAARELLVESLGERGARVIAASAPAGEEP